MSDANKTEITKKVTEAAVVWLRERGFRPIESEVTVRQGWCADVAGFAYVTRTEAMKLGLLGSRPRFDVADKSWPKPMADWNLRYAAIPSPLTALVEAKTSVGDFRRDRKFTSEPPTHLLYLAIPSGLVPLEAIPARWGVLTFAESGQVKIARKPTLQSVDVEQTLSVVADIAMRRDAFTAYERHREFKRQWVEHNNQRTNVHRIQQIVRLVADVAKGKYSAEEAVRQHTVGTKLPRWAMDELRSLEPAGRNPQAV